MPVFSLSRPPPRPSLPHLTVPSRTPAARVPSASNRTTWNAGLPRYANTSLPACPTPHAVGAGFGDDPLPPKETDHHRPRETWIVSCSAVVASDTRCRPTRRWQSRPSDCTRPVDRSSGAAFHQR